MKLSFRQFYWRWSRNLLCLLLFVLAVLFLARLGFAVYFGDVQELLKSPGDLRKSLFLGLRFDLIPLVYINAIPFVLLNICYFLPGKFPIKFSRSIIITILSCGYLLLTWVYIFDYCFYSYFQEHLNILFFGFFEDDTKALLISLWKNYNLPLFLIFLLVFHLSFIKIIKFLFSPYDFDLKVRKLDFKMPATFLAGLLVIAFLGRGNFNRLPLSLEDAHISSDEFLNKLSLNGVITFNRALKIRKTFGKGEFDYAGRYGYPNWQAAYEAAFEKAPGKPELEESLVTKVPGENKKSPHVVLIVMESFGSYWNQFDAPDFNLLGDLKDHFQDGLLFNNFLPSENGTIGSIVSVATSQIIRPGARFLSESDLMRTKISTSGNLPFKQAGYDTHFVYGGKLGWRDLGQFLTVQGYDKLWGAEEIKEAMPELHNIRSRDLGNEWGIFDEYLYSFIEEQLRTSSKPQFFLVLTTSNHPPFEFPTTYHKKEINLKDEILSKISIPKEIALKRFEGLQYANQKTAEFLTYIKNSALKNKVVTAITGDHSYWIAKNVGSEQEFKRYAVPLFISLPQSLKPKNVDLTKFGSHEDIFPTLYSLALPGAQYTKLGESLFEDDSHAINSSGLVANKSGAFHHGKFWKWKSLKDQTLEPAEENEELKKNRDHLQGLISITDLYLKSQKMRKNSDEGSGRPE